MQQRPSRSIQLDDDMRFQRRSWAVERAGWTVMGVVIVAAVLGLFSAGPLSGTMVHQPQGLADIEYGRFQRRSAPAPIRIRLQVASARPEGVSIEVDSRFLAIYKITSIQPQPAQSIAAAHGIRFRFDVVQGMPATVSFYVTPERMGFFRPKLTIGAGDAVEIPVFIYP
jgi:hypothetical protein